MDTVAGHGEAEDGGMVMTSLALYMYGLVYKDEECSRWQKRDEKL